MTSSSYSHHWWQVHLWTRIQAPRIWPHLRSLLPRSRFRNWYCWWRWCPRKCSARRYLRGNDPYSYLRWGPRSLRHDRRHHSLSVSRILHHQIPLLVVWVYVLTPAQDGHHSVMRRVQAHENSEQEEWLSQLSVIFLQTLKKSLFFSNLSL